MKYRFFENDELFFYKGIPIIDFEVIDEGKYKGANISHLSGLSGTYIRQIVQKMEEVRDGELDIYGFGPEDSVYVEAAGPTFKKEEFRNKCYITKAFDEDYNLVVPFSEIYTLMKDYLKEIDAWEKKTGKEKPGW